MMETLKSFFKLVRWFHELVAILPFVGLYFIIDYYIRQSGQACRLSGFNFMVVCICVQLLIAAGCILNDIMDRHIDKINKPHTHVVGRTISLTNAKMLFAATTLLIVLLSVYISCCMFKEWALICPAVYLLSVLYDVYFKKSPLWGNILIAALAAFIPLVILFFAKECIAFLHNPRINLLVYLYAAFPFLIIVPRELSLDISDMEGDRACGCRTLPIVIGAEKAKRVVALLILLLIGLSVPVVAHYTYLLYAFVWTDALLLFYLYKLKHCTQRIEYIRAGRLLWFIMISGLVGFTLATVC